MKRVRNQLIYTVSAHTPIRIYLLYMRWVLTNNAHAPMFSVMAHHVFETIIIPYYFASNNRIMHALRCAAMRVCIIKIYMHVARCYITPLHTDIILTSHSSQPSWNSAHGFLILFINRVHRACVFASVYKAVGCTWLHCIHQCLIHWAATVWQSCKQKQLTETTTPILSASSPTLATM